MAIPVGPVVSIVAPFRLFAVSVSAVRPLSPSFVRLTFSGSDLSMFADNGFDQRIKLVVPLPGSGLNDMPTGPDWYTRWRALPSAHQNPLRTYTVRAVRPLRREVDVDFVVHGGVGAAARWLAGVSPGDGAALIGPDARYPGEHGGIVFRAPPGAQTLLAGDETAVPAVAAILERLPAAVKGEVVLEVPWTDDIQQLRGPQGMRITWVTREGGERGSGLTRGVRVAAERLGLRAGHASGRDVTDTEHPDGLLWDVPTDSSSEASYAWVAGEAAVVRGIRRFLLQSCRLPRNAVAAMGYWRAGHAEDAA